MKKIDFKDLDPQFKNDVANWPGGENVKLCFACGTCTAGCPVSGVDDEFNPRKIIRQVILGMRKEVLSSPAIWKCAQCYSCTAKCPQNVRFREIVRALREMAVKEKHARAGLVEEVEQIGKLAQKFRRDMVSALVAGDAEYGDIEKRFAKVGMD